MMPTILDLAQQRGTYRKVAGTQGGEWHGPCPVCAGGRDRLFINPGIDRATCRSCGWSGDTIQWLRDVDGLSFQDAARAAGRPLGAAGLPRALPPTPPEAVLPPLPIWQQVAESFVAECVDTLWRDAGTKARAYLHRRGLSDDLLFQAGIGYNAAETWELRGMWGLTMEPDRKHVWLPRGIVFPARVAGDLWCIQLRRPSDTDGRGKYITVAGQSARGHTNTPYGIDWLAPRWPAVVVEGPMDALAIMQATDGSGLGIGACAVGTTRARRLKWVTPLTRCTSVLVALDNDPDPAKGEQHARWWIDVLRHNARRWRPWGGKDPSAMLEDGLDVRAWLEAGLAAAA